MNTNKIYAIFDRTAYTIFAPYQRFEYECFRYPLVYTKFEYALEDFKSEYVSADNVTLIQFEINSTDTRDTMFEVATKPNGVVKYARGFRPSKIDKELDLEEIFVLEYTHKFPIESANINDRYPTCVEIYSDLNLAVKSLINWILHDIKGNYITESGDLLDYGVYAYIHKCKKDIEEGIYEYTDEIIRFVGGDNKRDKDGNRIHYIENEINGVDLNKVIKKLFPNIGIILDVKNLE